MRSRFWIVATVLSFLLLALVLSFGLRKFEDMKNGSDQSSFGLPAVVKTYGYKAMNSTAELTNEITWKLKAASMAVGDAVKAITQ